MADPEIRAATIDDADDLAAAYRSAYSENSRLGFPATAGSATAEDVSGWIRENRVLVATVDGDVVGGVRLEETEPTRAKLSRLGVHENWKGEGIGGALLDRAEAVARDEWYDAIRLTTPPEHPFLADMYRRRGYEESGPYPLEYREYDEIVMEKELR